MIENGRTILNEHNRYHANTPDREITYVVLAQRFVLHLRMLKKKATVKLYLEVCIICKQKSIV